MREPFFCTMMAAMMAVAGTLPAVDAAAGEVVIENARVAPQGDGRYRFDVTLRHGDTGWDHFADKWQVIGPDGAVLGERVLAHPHVDEQPFTRSLSGVELPAGVTMVEIRAHDSVHGWSAQTVTVQVPDR